MYCSFYSLDVVNLDNTAHAHYYLQKQLGYTAHALKMEVGAVGNVPHDN